MRTLPSDERPRGLSRMARLHEAQQALRAIDASGRNDAWIAGQLHIEPVTLQSWRRGSRAPQPMHLALLRSLARRSVRHD